MTRAQLARKYVSIYFIVWSLPIKMYTTLDSETTYFQVKQLNLYKVMTQIDVVSPSYFQPSINSILLMSFTTQINVSVSSSLHNCNAVLQLSFIMFVHFCFSLCPVGYTPQTRGSCAQKTTFPCGSSMHRRQTNAPDKCLYDQLFEWGKE